jgi:hypothetical protein
MAMAIINLPIAVTIVMRGSNLNYNLRIRWRRRCNGHCKKHTQT